MPGGPGGGRSASPRRRCEPQPSIVPARRDRGLPRSRRLGRCGAYCGRAGAIYPVGASAFADFYIARGRALAACGRGQSDMAELAAELERIRDEGERLGIRVALRGIETAIN